MKIIWFINFWTNLIKYNKIASSLSLARAAHNTLYVHLQRTSLFATSRSIKVRKFLPFLSLAALSPIHPSIPHSSFVRHPSFAGVWSCKIFAGLAPLTPLSSYLPQPLHIAEHVRAYDSPFIHLLTKLTMGACAHNALLFKRAQS
jgi:hypothetical protein